MTLNMLLRGFEIDLEVDMFLMFAEIWLNVFSVCNNNKKCHFLEHVMSRCSDGSSGLAVCSYLRCS